MPLVLGLIIVVARLALFGSQTPLTTSQEGPQKPEAAKASDFTGSGSATQNSAAPLEK